MVGQFGMVPVVGRRNGQRCNVAAIKAGWDDPMRVAFFASDKQREQDLARAFTAGVVKHGDTVNDIYPYGVHHGPGEWHHDFASIRDNIDVAVMAGVKSISLYRECRDAGINTVMIDKGYQRHSNPVGRFWEYWRIAVNAHHPTDTLMDIERPHDRMAGVKLSRWREPTKRGHIVIAGSSAKYHRFYNLPEPTQWATDVVADLRKYTTRPIIYRPKPSWGDAVPIQGAGYSRGKKTKLGFLDTLENAHAIVTHGSNACFEAVTSGVPCIILGNGVAKPISSTLISKINNPLLASMQQRQKWLAALAYSQWTLLEFRSGEAWATIRPQIGA